MKECRKEERRGQRPNHIGATASSCLFAHNALKAFKMQDAVVCGMWRINEYNFLHSTKEWTKLASADLMRRLIHPYLAFSTQICVCGYVRPQLHAVMLVLISTSPAHICKHTQCHVATSLRLPLLIDPILHRRHSHWLSEQERPTPKTQRENAHKSQWTIKYPSAHPFPLPQPYKRDFLLAPLFLE